MSSYRRTGDKIWNPWSFLTTTWPTLYVFHKRFTNAFFFFCPENLFLSHMHFKHLSREIHILKSDPNNRLIPYKILISLENYIAPLISSLFCPFPNLRWAPSEDFWISLQKLNKFLINTASQLQNHDDSYAL